MQLEVLGRLPEARPIVFDAIARAFAPQPSLTVSAWAEANRIVSAESGSRYPGPWRNDRAPHLVDVMDALGPQDPCEDVVMVASAQVGKSEVGLNFSGYVVDVDPGPMITVLPSIEEASKFNKTKLQPTIDATPALQRKVLEYTDRSEQGSTVNFKRFARGFNQLTFAGSSKGLQMISARYTFGDEISEWPAEAGERGDPVGQLKKRTETYERDRKRLWTSTPSIVGACRITDFFNQSDMGRRFVPCPHCGAYQVLRFDRLKWQSEDWPHRAWFACAAHGCAIEAPERADMLRAGVWIATAGEGPGDHFEADQLERWRSRPVPARIRGFHIWKAYSLMTSWDGIVSEWLDAKDAPNLLRVFTQQVLGEAFEEKGDAPDADLLHANKVVERHRGEPGLGPLVFTGAVDVQGDRLEWAVWGWSEGLTRWLIDWGVVEGDPHQGEVWAKLASEVLRRSYSPSGGEPVAVEAWAVDSGFATQSVYNFTRARPGVYAIDGRAGRLLPMIGTPSKVDVTFGGKRRKRGAMVWPVGSWALKSDHYSAVRAAIAGPDENGALRPGTMILPNEADPAYCRQLTSEYLATVERRAGGSHQEWRKLKGQPNEALDIACYARAMAFHLGLDRLKADQWAVLRSERSAPHDPAQAELFAVEVAAAVAAEPGGGRQRRRRGVRGKVQ